MSIAKVKEDEILLPAVFVGGVRAYQSTFDQMFSMLRGIGVQVVEWHPSSTRFSVKGFSEARLVILCSDQASQRQIILTQDYARDNDIPIIRVIKSTSKAKKRVVSLLNRSGLLDEYRDEIRTRRREAEEQVRRRHRQRTRPAPKPNAPKPTAPAAPPTAPAAPPTAPREEPVPKPKNTRKQPSKSLSVDLLSAVTKLQQVCKSADLHSLTVKFDNADGETRIGSVGINTLIEALQGFRSACDDGDIETLTFDFDGSRASVEFEQIIVNKDTITIG